MKSRSDAVIPVLTSDDLDTQTSPVQILLFIAVLFIYGRMVPALEVVLVFITIYICTFIFIFLLKTVRSCARVFLTSDTH